MTTQMWPMWPSGDPQFDMPAIDDSKWIFSVSFQVFTAHMLVFWVIRPCRMKSKLGWFRGSCCFHLTGLLNLVQAEYQVTEGLYYIGRLYGLSPIRVTKGKREQIFYWSSWCWENEGSKTLGPKTVRIVKVEWSDMYKVCVCTVAIGRCYATFDFRRPPWYEWDFCCITSQKSEDLVLGLIHEVSVLKYGSANSGSKD
jgi:hypothetical protein